MKKLMTTAAIATFISGAVVAATSFDIKSQQTEVDSMLACLWFPICKEPDYQQQQQIDVESSVGEGLDLESLYACLWFPICKEPDQPIRNA
ncbi:hypothetical protein [Alkalimonas sp.]|uniref:hypothetical protein n=1 Tax=Alkalimonas sp. TaxID=1872453 RepID=UPI00263B2E2B|nr:hypothetical protein [Alkalimonas sp.]MCC5826726.1 hypothetical protein [Alkalimonas sp.]